MDYTKVLYFDVETTGFNAKKENVIEFAYIFHDKEANVREQNTFLVKPSSLISDKITELTGITNEMVAKDGIEQSELAYKMANLISDGQTLLVAHNALFDIQFLEATIQREIDVNFRLKNDVIDTLTIAKDRFDYPHKLINCVEHYDVQFTPTHRALDDVLAMVGVIKKMKVERDDLAEYVNIVGYYPKFGVPNVNFRQLVLLPQNG